MILFNSTSALTEESFDTDLRYEACADINLTYSDLMFKIEHLAGQDMITVYIYEIDDNGISARNGQSFCEIERDGFNKELEVVYEKTPGQEQVKSDIGKQLVAQSQAYKEQTAVERNTNSAKSTGRFFILILVLAGLYYGTRKNNS